LVEEGGFIGCSQRLRPLRSLQAKGLQDSVSRATQFFWEPLTRSKKQVAQSIHPLPPQ